MKKILLIGVIGLSAFLVGCSPDPEPMTQQLFELKKLEMEQQHELEMAKATIQQTNQGTTYSAPPEQVQYQQGYDSSPPPPQEESSGIGSAALGAVAGLAAGYAMSELLDDGWRSYTNNSGQTVYYDRSGRQVDKGSYDTYKNKNPTRHKLSSYNQKGKSLVNTAKDKTVTGYKYSATKVNQGTSNFKQKATKMKSSFFSRSSSRSSRSKGR